MTATISQVRQWTGSTPDDSAVNAALAEFDGETFVAERAALSILLIRKADWGSTKWSVSGEYAEENTEGYKSLLADIAQLRARIGDDVATVDTQASVTLGAICGPGNPR